jgi:hypothetical protein
VGSLGGTSVFPPIFLSFSQPGNKVNALMVDMTYGTVRSVGELLSLSGTKDHIIDLLYMKDNIIACSLHHGERVTGACRQLLLC